jgi:transcriptional regulator with XRE-family HTH domain
VVYADLRCLYATKSEVERLISAGQIRAGRSLIGAKQTDLAKASGISLATLNNIERGVGDPRSSTLDAIESALQDAGVVLDSDAVSESVSLNILSRPKAYDTLSASQKILHLLGPGSLNSPDEVLFFARRDRSTEGEEVGVKVGLLIEAKSRNILFDQVNFSIENGSRVAEIAGIMLAAFAFHRSALFYVKSVREDTTAAEDLDALGSIRSVEWHALDHPADFFDVFSNWEELLSTYANRAGHPLGDLAALINKFELA